jgi:hypothetical protein
MGITSKPTVQKDGAVLNWEKAIAAKDLPAAVVKAIEKLYPTAKEVMQVTAVKKGKDVLEGYEIGLRTVDKESVEVTLAADGKVLEDGGVRK